MNDYLIYKSKIRPYLKYLVSNVNKNLIPMKNGIKTAKQTTLEIINGLFHDTTNAGSGEYTVAFSITNELASGNYTNYIRPTGQIIELEPGKYKLFYKYIKGSSSAEGTSGNRRTLLIYELKDVLPHNPTIARLIVTDVDDEVEFEITEKIKIVLGYQWYSATQSQKFADIYFKLFLKKI